MRRSAAFLLVAGCLGRCGAADSGPVAPTCADTLGDPVEAGVVYVGNGILDYTAEDPDVLDAEGFLHVLSTEAEYATFWKENQEVLGDEPPVVDFTTHQVVVANGPGVNCQNNIRLRGFFRSGADLVAWIYTDYACASCDTFELPRIEVWTVEPGSIRTCADVEVCGESG